MKRNKETLRQWFGLFIVGAALILLFKLLDSLGWITGALVTLFSVLTPFIIGFIIAFILYAPMHKIEGWIARAKWKFLRKAAKPIAIVAAYLLLLGVLSLVFVIVIPALITALEDLITNVPTYYENVLEFARQHAKDGGLLASIDLESKAKEFFEYLQGHITAEKLIEYLKGVLGVTSSLISVVLSLIVSVYMLIGRDGLVRSIKRLLSSFLSPSSMEFGSHYLHRTSTIFYNYIFSQMIDACIVFVLATIGFLLAKIPHPAAMGILLGLLNFIPYFGSLFGGILAVLLALLSGNFYGAVFIAVYLLVTQQIDANVIQPRIIGGRVGIKPIYVLLGITVGGGLFGFWGVLLGAPCMGVVQMIVTDILASRERKKALKEQTKEQTDQ